MKRKLTFLILLLITIFTANTVKAEEPFAYDWSTNKSEYVALFNAPYMDGYATTEYIYDENISIIRTYDINGNLKKEKETTSFIYAMKTKDKDLYTIESFGVEGKTASSGNRYYLVLYNEDLEIVKKQPIDSNVIYFPFTYYNDWATFYITEDKVYVQGYDNQYYAFKRNLSSYTTVDYESNKTIIYPDYFYDAIESLASNYRFINTGDFSDNNVAIGTIETADRCIPVQPKGNVKSFSSEPSKELLDESCYYSKVYVFDNEGEELWSEEYYDHYYLPRVRIINDYVIVSAYGDESNIFIYDMKGKLVQTISSDYGIAFLEKTPTGFIFSETDYMVNSPFYTSQPIIDITSSGNITRNSNSDIKGAIVNKENHQIYYIPVKVEAVVKAGKGEVNVLNNPRAGEEVEFEVKPEDGYEIDSVIVTDVKGNKVVFTDYRFTMPTADVTIEVVFSKIVLNPETSDIAIIFIGIVAILSTIVLVKQYKKLRFLN